MSDTLFAPRSLPATGPRRPLDRASGINLGGSREVAAGATERLIDLRGGLGVGELVTVQLSRGDAPTGTIARARASVHFGVGGTTHALFVDVVTGCTFTLLCESLQVDLENQGTGTLTLRASVGYQPAGGRHKPQLTLDIPILAPAATVSLTVPAFATGVEIDRTPDASFRADVLDSAGTVLYERTIGAGNYLTSPLPLSSDAQTVRITANGAITRGRAIFPLAL